MLQRNLAGLLQVACTGVMPLRPLLGTTRCRTEALAMRPVLACGSEHASTSCCTREGPSGPGLPSAAHLGRPGPSSLANLLAQGRLQRLRAYSPAALPSPLQPHSRQLSTSSWWKFWHRNNREDEPEPGGEALRPPEPLPAQPSAALQRELRAINTAIIVNIGILVAKLLVWTVTNSGALLAEALHSVADTMNQVLLRAGAQQSRRKPTEQHPYGFHREKYIYSLISAVGIFCLGAGASVVHGIQSLLDPPELMHLGWSGMVLLGSAAAELFSFRVALAALRVGAREQGQTLWGYITRGRDPTTTAVLAEDAGAVAGLGIAGLSTYLTYSTGNPVFDALGSISVGVLMGAVAVALIRNNKRFLIGQSMSPEAQDLIIEHLRSDPMVLAVIDPKSEELGDGVYRFKAEIQWSGDCVVEKYLKTLGRDSIYSQIRATACSSDVDSALLKDALDLAMMQFGRGVIRTVGEEIDRLEVELKRMVPGLVYVDLETDKGRSELSAIGTLDRALESAAPAPEELPAKDF